MNKSIAEIIAPGVIGDAESYWAMHFCSLLETMNEHKLLQYGFYAMPAGELRTLSNLVGLTHRGFFTHLKQHLRNWGLQYFLSHYLMSKEGHAIFKRVLSDISSNYKFDLVTDFRSYGVYVAGEDSVQGEHFLRACDARILGYNQFNVNNVYNDIKFVDLCILVNVAASDHRDIAILGEVEGNHGIKIWRQSFWNKKSSMCHFGIGVSHDNENITISNVKFNDGWKTILMIGSKQHVMVDYYFAIGIMETFLSIHHKHEIYLQHGQREVVNIIREHWTRPISELIEKLRGMIISEQSAGLNDYNSPVISTPKIILN